MPTEEQFLQAERDGLLTPEEQQGINELRDMGGFPAAMGLPPKKLGKAGGPPSAPVAAPMAAAPSPAPEAVTTPPQPVQGAQPQSFSDALWASLASEGEKQRAAVGGLGNALNPFGTPPPPGEEGIVPAAMNAGVNLLTAASPILSPLGTLGSVGGGTLARMGLVPGSPETAETVGGLVGGLAPLGPGLIRGGARLLSPALRTAEKAAGAAKLARAGEEAALGARRVEQGMAGIGQAGQMAERGAAGAAVPEVVENIGNRLAGEAGKTFEKSVAAQPKALTLKPTKAVPETTVPSTLVDEFGKPLTTTIPAKAAKTLTEKDYNNAFLELRKGNERAGQAAIDFDRAVTTKLGRVTGPNASAMKLAKDPDLVNAIIPHATPIEATIIEKAMAAGKPISKMPYTEAELMDLGREILQGGNSAIKAAGGGTGIISPMLHYGLGGAGLGIFGALTGHPGAGLTAAGTVLAARLGLKALDLALGSRPLVATMRGLSHLTPGAPGVAQILAGVGGRLAMPQRLEPKER